MYYMVILTSIGLNDTSICSLLYHDGRRSILAALKLLLTARPGVTWTLELDERILELITKFTENLISNGIIHSFLLCIFVKFFIYFQLLVFNLNTIMFFTALSFQLKNLKKE